MQYPQYLTDNLTGQVFTCFVFLCKHKNSVQLIYLIIYFSTLIILASDFSLHLELLSDKLRLTFMSHIKTQKRCYLKKPTLSFIITTIKKVNNIHEGCN